MHLALAERAVMLRTKGTNELIQGDALKTANKHAVILKKISTKVANSSVYCAT